MNNKKTSLTQKFCLIIFGLFLCVILLEAGLRAGGFVMLFLQEQRNKLSLCSGDSPYVIMCLGESTTARGGKDSWPSQLEEVLNKRSGTKKFRVINKGVEGTNSSVILFNLNKNLDKYAPQMVVAMMGINDGIACIPYEEKFSAKVALFFDSFRIRKLCKIMHSRLAHKFEEYRASFLRKKETHKDSSHKDRVGETEYRLLEAVRANPRDAELCCQLVECYRVQGKFQEAEEILKSALRTNSENQDLLLALGQIYLLEENLGGAEAILKRTIEIHKNFEPAYVTLAECFRAQGRPAEAAALLTKALESGVVPTEAIYITLGNSLIQIGEATKAEAAFKKALEINPRSEPAFTELGILYRNQGRLEDLYFLADSISKKEIAVDRLYAFVGTCYMEQGKREKAEEFFKKANELRQQYYNPQTRHNYLKLKEMVIRRGAKLVCVQYPLRSVAPLKSIFDSQEGVAFVDNEDIFKNALRDAPYSDYFTDNFGGEFGHATAKGNRLIAENIANVIVTEVLKMPSAYRTQDNENIVH